MDARSPIAYRTLGHQCNVGRATSPCRALVLTDHVAEASADGQRGDRSAGPLRSRAGRRAVNSRPSGSTLRFGVEHPADISGTSGRSCLGFTRTRHRPPPEGEGLRRRPGSQSESRSLGGRPLAGAYPTRRRPRRVTVRARRAGKRRPSGGSRRPSLTPSGRRCGRMGGPLRCKLLAGFGDLVQLEAEQATVFVDAGQEQFVDGGLLGWFVNLPAGPRRRYRLNLA